MKAVHLLLFCVSLCVALAGIVGGCMRATPERLPSWAAAENNLAEVLDAALARGERVKATPRGDFHWRWVKQGEHWNFEQWHYEVVK